MVEFLNSAAFPVRTSVIQAAAVYARLPPAWGCSVAGARHVKVALR